MRSWGRSGAGNNEKLLYYFLKNIFICITFKAPEQHLCNSLVNNQGLIDFNYHIQRLLESR